VLKHPNVSAPPRFRPSLSLSRHHTAPLFYYEVVWETKSKGLFSLRPETGHERVDVVCLQAELTSTPLVKLVNKHRGFPTVSRYLFYCNFKKEMLNTAHPSQEIASRRTEPNQNHDRTHDLF
jgi:hypothetical protein